MVRIQPSCINIRYDPLAATHFDQLPWLRPSPVCQCLPLPLDTHVATFSILIVYTVRRGPTLTVDYGDRICHDLRRINR